jgi:Spy/CpxP family protein refolding chaperone
MKKLITLIAGAALATTLTTAAFAQAAGPAGGAIQNQTQKGGQAGQRHGGPMRMIKELNLTKEQQKQVKELSIKLQLKGKDQNPADKATKVDRKAMMERRQQFMKELAKILTPEQNEKLKKLTEDAKAKLGDRAKGNKGNKGKGGAAGGTGTGTTGGTTKSGGG